VLQFWSPWPYLSGSFQENEFLNWLKSLHVFSYKRKPALFSPAERSFPGVLDQVLGSEYKVFGKVRIADLIRPDNGAGRQAALKRIIAKHVDFVVCDPGNLPVIGVVELDDKSHNGRRRHALVDGAFGSTKIPMPVSLRERVITLPKSGIAFSGRSLWSSNKISRRQHLLDR